MAESCRELDGAAMTNLPDNVNYFDASNPWMQPDLTVEEWLDENFEPCTCAGTPLDVPPCERCTARFSAIDGPDPDPDDFYPF